MMVTAVLGFGSNKGNRLLQLKKALKTLSLSKQLNLLSVSGIYETEPWGYKAQNCFFNCAAVFLTYLKPAQLLKLLKDYERSAGRKESRKWHAREIDIDILFYGSKSVNSGSLKIPHPYMAERNFVLKPLVEILPGFIHPVLKKNIFNLYNSSKDNCKVNRVSSFDK